MLEMSADIFFSKEELYIFPQSHTHYGTLEWSGVPTVLSARAEEKNQGEEVLKVMSLFKRDTLNETSEVLESVVLQFGFPSWSTFINQSQRIGIEKEYGSDIVRVQPMRLIKKSHRCDLAEEIETQLEPIAIARALHEARQRLQA